MIKLIDVPVLIVNQWDTKNMIVGRDNRNAEVFLVMNFQTLMDLLNPKDDYETLMKKVISLGSKYHKQGCMSELTTIVEKYFGVGGKITEAIEDDLGNMQLAYDEMQLTARKLNLYTTVEKV